MYLRGWVMVYPNYENQSSFSTNHMEPGEHTGANGKKQNEQENGLTTAVNYYLTVPIIQEEPKLSETALEALPVFDVYHKLAASWKALRLTSLARVEALKYKGIFLPSVDSRKCVLDYVSDQNLEEKSAPKYLLIHPQFGFSNQIRAIEDALAVASVLNRILVLPPFLIGDSRIPVSQVFQIPSKIHQGQFEASLIPYEEFLDRNLESPVWISRIASLDGLAHYLEPQKTLFDNLAGPKEIVKLTSVNRKSLDYTRMYSGCTDQYLTFDIFFTAFTGFPEKALSADYTKMLKSFWKLNQELNGIVETVKKSMGDYGCVHVRRSDFYEYCLNLKKEVEGPNPRQWLKSFKFDNCYPSADYLAEKIKPQAEKYKVNSLYVASDDRSVQNSLHSLLPNLQIYGNSLFDTYSLKFPDILAFLEQKLCSEATYFIGNSFSTFSRKIVDFRSGNSTFIGATEQ